ncbi:MAG: hypothetical protein JWM76_3110 [Pseudonocardiales bacterium]|nr:hypothetical protein [Pseudonocardiales bacterium]
MMDVRQLQMRRAHGKEDGSAVIEFIFVAVLVLVPLLYLIVTVATIQRSRLAVTNAARDVGRAIATSTSSAEARTRAEAALRIALSGQNVSASDVQLKYVRADTGCDSASVDPPLDPGAEFAVCVVRSQDLPAVPRILAGRGVTTIGRFVVHIDQFAVRTP